MRRAQTIAKKKEFHYTTCENQLNIIYDNTKGKLTHTISTENLIAIINEINNRYGGGSFILDNSAMPAEDRILGFGTLMCEVLNKERPFAPVASRLGAIFCSAGILEHFKVKGMRNNPIHFRLIQRPEKPADFLNLIKKIPE